MKNENKTILKNILISLLLIFVAYFLLSIFSNDCYEREGMIIAESKLCNCQGIKLPKTIFGSGSCLGFCGTDCICKHSSKVDIEYNCSEYPERIQRLREQNYFIE